MHIYFYIYRKQREENRRLIKMQVYVYNCHNVLP